ncbi:RNA polymerase sigma factor [Pectobacterium phage Q19]|uniref:RNA polymerase sigma factor n=1 Tax=Pectobacterium phage Q19 TaxID=2500576 RepID=A0A679A2V5_9CAUD|nr:RNA polymerase sigma factor [Pectobacterium phage Q19]
MMINRDTAFKALFEALKAKASLNTDGFLAAAMDDIEDTMGTIQPANLVHAMDAAICNAMPTNHDDMTVEQVAICYDVVMDSLSNLQALHGDDVSDTLGHSVFDVIDLLHTAREAFVWSDVPKVELCEPLSHQMLVHTLEQMK